MPNKQLTLSIDYSKIAVGIYSNVADGECHDVRIALENQINNPKVFIEEHHEDEFGLVCTTKSGGPRVHSELKKKWSRIEFLITCIYNGRTIPCADGFELYVVKKENNHVIDLVKITEPCAIDLEDVLIEKSSDNNFDAAMRDNGLSFYLLEELTAQK
jgi:hypothetical protein